MNGTLGRDKVWNDQIWNDVDKAVREEMGRIRVAQKVFPCTILYNVQAVPVAEVPTADDTPPVLKADDKFLPFIEMSMPFTVTQAQVENEGSMHLGLALARLAARSLAAAEDIFLFLAEANSAAFITILNNKGINLTNTGAIPDGIVKSAKPFPTGAKDDIFAALAAGIGLLNTANQPGPYALFLPPRRYADTFQPITAKALATNADRIVPLVPGGFYAVNSLPDDVGILVSLGGEPTTIYLGTEPTTALAFVNDKGEYKFRVFERIQLVVRDSTAFVTLDFTKAP
jgi:uncharacterized linocin/CFP29 family protein